MYKRQGSEKRPPIDLYEIVLEPGDLVVLCSDGLTRHVEDGEIGVIAGDESPDVAADMLVRLARERGGEDNITVAIIQYGARLDESTRPMAVPAVTRPIAIPQPLPTPPVAVQPTVERHRSLWPLTFALAAIMVVLIVVLWVVVQRATTL